MLLPRIGAAAIFVVEVGALGVLLNAFSLLQLLRPFERTGPLIKTVQEIMNLRPDPKRKSLPSTM